MSSTLGTALDLVERSLEAKQSSQAGQLLLDAMRPLGAHSLWARSFSLAPNWIDPKVNMTFKTTNHALIRRDDWWGTQAQIHADSTCPLAAGAARFLRPFLCHDITALQPKAYCGYYEALSSYNVASTLAVPHFGRDGTAGALTIWFERAAFDPRELTALKMSGLMLFDRMREMDEWAKPPTVLSSRERDCLAFVAEGKSDWEISVILSIAQSTAHAHVENAKRKLGARTRAQAVARLVTLRLM